MNIGIVGSGNMGASMGKIWATKGHKVLFSFSTDQEKLRAVAAAAGAAVPEALKAAGDCEGKTLFSCVNCLKPDFSGLEGGTSTSAAEEIVKLAHGAKMVEAIPPMAQILAADSRRLDGRQTVPSTAATTLPLRRAWHHCCMTWTSIRLTPLR